VATKKGKKGKKTIKKVISRNVVKKPKKGAREKTKAELAKSKAPKFDMNKLRSEIQDELQNGGMEGQIVAQRSPIKEVIDRAKHPKKSNGQEFIWTGIPGFDDLFEDGIPRTSTVLVAGGAGSGKTIMCCQIATYHAKHGDKCLYMSFEENEKRLRQHMNDFGWNPEDLEKKGKLMIQRFSPFDITRSVDALLMKAKGELLIEIDPVILPKHYKPEIIVVDSLTAIASAFTGKEDSYRIYIEQLFRFFERIGATAFLITETRQIPTIFSQTGVEEFLADGVIVLYNLTRGNVRENAVEVLKLRGAKHQKKIVAMQITSKGIVVYPEQEIFGEIRGEKE